MKYVFYYQELYDAPQEPRIVTIGNFDGVHRGHQAVLRSARKDADRRGLDLAALTFEPHPAELLKPDGPRLRLVEPDRKADLLGECGADLVLAQRFDRAFAELTAEQFIANVLVRSLDAKMVIVGENFRFGQGRAGDVETLHRFGEELGFEVRGEHLVREGEGDVSSSRIRRLLQAGDVGKAADLLGREHEVPGTVIAGHGRGAGLGFPTLNLGEVQVLVPGPGIYAARCKVGEDVIPSAAYLGDRPTMGHGYAMEAHLLDFEGDLYGKRVSLSFVERVRGEEKFEDTESLVRQVKLDIEQTRLILGASS